MTRPADAGAFAERMYTQLSPYAYDDANQNWALLTLLGAQSAMSQEVEDLAKDGSDGPGTPGYSVLLDVNNIPAKGLPWLGQFVGAVVNTALSVPDQRAQLLSVNARSRGSIDALKAAPLPYLTGLKKVLVRERDAAVCPSLPAYGVSVLTYRSETDGADIGSTNMLLNGGLETNTTNWAPTNCTIGRYPPVNAGLPALSGSMAGDIKCTNTTTAWIYQQTGLATGTPGLTYSVQAQVSRLVGARQASLQMNFYNASSVSVGQFNSAGVLAPNGSWARLKLEGCVAPATTSFISCFVLFGGGTVVANDEFLVDNIQLEQGSTCSDYIPTDAAIASRAAGSGPIGAALLSQKPAGIILAYSVLDGQNYTTLNANYASYNAVNAHYTSYDGVSSDQPGI